MISKSPTIRHERGHSAMQKTAVGSGSRPGTKNHHPLPTSAPAHHKSLGGRDKTPNKPL